MRDREVQANAKETAVETELVERRNGHQAKHPVVQAKRCERLDIGMHQAVEQHVAVRTNDGTNDCDGPTDWQVTRPAQQAKAQLGRVLSSQR